MKVVFNKQSVESLPVGTHHDTKQPGLVLNVTETSRRFGIYVWNPNANGPKKGAPVRAAIGPWPAFTVEAAREKARDMIHAIKRGEQEKPRAKKTLGDLGDDHEDRLKAKGAKDPGHPNWVLDEGCPDWRNRAADSITDEEVEKRHNEIAAARGPSAAARFVKTLRTVYRKSKVPCPAVNTDIATPIPRAIVADRDQLTAIRAELDKQDPYWRDYFLLSILTGARRSNVAGMRFEDVRSGTWTIPGTESKTGDAIKLPLVPEAIDIIERRREVQKTGFVFPSNGRSGHLTHTWEKWNEVRSAAGCPGVTQHDLRRTLISRLAEAGVNPAIAAKAAGHKNVATTLAIYTFVRQDQVLEALKKLG